MGANPRNYPDAMASPESGRPMTRGEKLMSSEAQGRSFSYLQPGWWRSLTDPDDLEGRFVEADNQLADMGRLTAGVVAPPFATR